MHKTSLLPRHQRKTLRQTIIDKLTYGVALWLLLALCFFTRDLVQQMFWTQTF